MSKHRKSRSTQATGSPSGLLPEGSSTSRPPPAAAQSPAPPPAVARARAPVAPPPRRALRPEPTPVHDAYYAPVPATRTRNTKWLVLAAIAIAWLFGFGVRAVWLSDNADTPHTTFEGHRLLTTNDAYFYAAGVQHEVKGTLAANPRVPGAADSVVVAIGSGVVSLFDLPIEEVCLWLPAVLAPLIALSLILLGLLFDQLLWGFLASLVATLGFSYWNRTVPGYFDTDMVAIPYVLGVTALVIAALWRRRSLFGAVAALLAVAAPWVHPGSERVLAAVMLAALAYTLVFSRRQPSAYRVVVMLLVAFLPLPIWMRVLLIAALEITLSRWRMPRWSLWPLAALAALGLGLVLWKSSAMSQLLGVAGISVGDAPAFLPEVHFQGLGDTVVELANPSLARLGERIAGGVALLVSGVAGYLLACWRFRPLLVLLPLLGLGTVLGASGLRYTIFAVPVVALGNLWLAVLVGRAVARWWPDRAALLRVAVPGLLCTPVLVPAVTQALSLPSKTALNTQEAELLTQLGTHAKPGDVLMTWWDYAYAAWYFAGVNTIIDGTKQNMDTWLVAEILFTQSQREAAGLARLATEHAQRVGPLDAIVGSILATWQAANHRPMSEFVPALRAGAVELSPPTRQTFVYVPWRFVSILMNVSAIRPARGLVPDAELRSDDFFYKSVLDQAGQARGEWRYDSQQKLLVGPRGERWPVNKVADVTLDKQAIPRVRETEARADGRTCVVNLLHSALALYMSCPLYTSVLGQLMFRAAPEPAYFELNSYSRGGVVYRVLP